MAEMISISSFFPFPGTADTELLHLQRLEGAKGFVLTDEIGAEAAHVGIAQRLPPLLPPSPGLCFSTRQLGPDGDFSSLALR